MQLFIPFPVLETKNLNLVELTMKDLDDFHALRSDDRIMQYIQGRKTKSKEDTIALIHKTKSIQDEEQGVNWAIKLKSNHQLIGTIGFYRIQWNNFRGEIGYILHPDFQGKGLMSEAMQAVLDYGFRTKENSGLEFHTIEAVLDPNNKASENILIRNGFVKEGHYKENYFAEGTFYDSLVYTKFKP